MGATKTHLIAIGKRVYHSHTLTHLSVCFAGRIPTELGQLAALTQLHLQNNELTGECNQTCLQLVWHKRVDHSITHLSACFTGRIPTELGQLTALTELFLHTNELTGECDQNSPDHKERVYNSITHLPRSYPNRARPADCSRTVRDAQQLPGW